MPILKSNSKYSNVAMIPYDVLKKNDFYTFNQSKNRGAARFRKVEKDTKPWFDMRFNKNLKAQIKTIDEKNIDISFRFQN
jgi:hypothetical protein